MRTISTAVNPLCDLLGELDLAGGGCAEAGPPRGRLRSMAASTAGWAWPWTRAPQEQT